VGGAQDPGGDREHGGMNDVETLMKTSAPCKSLRWNFVFGDRLECFSKILQIENQWLVKKSIP
jgi:hypothetical protein